MNDSQVNHSQDNLVSYYLTFLETHPESLREVMSFLQMLLSVGRLILLLEAASTCAPRMLEEVHAHPRDVIIALGKTAAEAFLKRPVKINPRAWINSW